ncbi:MAG: S8 family peptidase, partial [Acidobacteria bacterium]|nr:S8 family peptidase [Acidobacteriota bacterium]
MRVRIAVAMTLILAVGAPLFSQRSPDARPRGEEGIDKLEPPLIALQRHSRWTAGHIPVIVQFSRGGGTGRGWAGRDERSAGETRLDLIERETDVVAAGGVHQDSFEHLHAVSALVDPAALVRLARHPRVARISIDHPVSGSLATTARSIGADQVWAGSPGMPAFLGTGVTVAVLDSGAKAKGDLEQAVIKEESDKYGHGTHVAGIIAGSGAASSKWSRYPESYRGIAPQSRVISLKVLDSRGTGKTSDVLKALEWCIENRKRYNIRIINLSLGHPVFESYKTDPLCQMVDKCVREGMVVVVSAGNYGKAGDGVVYGGISSPANSPSAITVGAVDNRGTISRRDDAVASYSSRGPTAIDGLIKPDIVAPGNKVVSASRTDQYLYKNYPPNRVLPAGLVGGDDDDDDDDDDDKRDSYFILSGTSMAAPAVSGTVALMLQANPSLTPNSVKAILAYTAERMTTPNILEQGNGYLNAEGAV